MTILKDGVGTGKMARVNGNNRLTVDSIQSSRISYATEQGDSYNINTGLVTLTSAAESGVGYIRNNETRDLVITGLVVIQGPSTGALSGTIDVYEAQGI